MLFSSDSEIEKERDEAFHSLDREKILAFYKKLGAPMPSTEQVLWAGVHKARLYLKGFSDEERASSRKWLIEHGFEPGFSFLSKNN